MSHRHALGFPFRLFLAGVPNLALIILALLLPSDGVERGPALFSIIGNFHILVLHLPIALLVIVPLFELLDNTVQAQNGTRRLCQLAAITTWLTATLGVIYGHFNGFVGDKTQWHLWSGIFASCLASASWLLLHQARLFRLTIQLLAIFVVFYAAHIGGEMVHGRGFPLKSNDKVAKGNISSE
jgi:hypothetical protein